VQVHDRFGAHVACKSLLFVTDIEYSHFVAGNKFVDVLDQETNHASNIGLGLWCLTPLSTIFQLYRGCTSNINNYMELAH